MQNAGKLLKNNRAVRQLLKELVRPLWYFLCPWLPPHKNTLRADFTPDQLPASL